MVLWWSKAVRERLRHRHAEADRQLRESRRLREEDQRTIVRPMRAADAKNHFSELIRAAIVDGYGPSEHRKRTT